MSDQINKTFQVRACRICLNSKCNNMITLESHNGWLQRFEYCFSVTITNEDGSRRLCQQCANNVNNYSKFKELCLKSDHLWKSLTTVKCYAEKLLSNNCVKTKVLDTHQQTIDSINQKFVANIEPHNTDSNTFDGSEEDHPVTIEVKNEISTEKTNSDTKNKEIAKDNIELTCNYKTSITAKFKDAFTCKKCMRSYGSKLWYFKHLKLCNTKNKNSDSSNKITKTGSKVNGVEGYPIPERKKNTDNRQHFLHLCGLCKFSSINLNNVAKHLDKHWTNKDLQCMMCGSNSKDQAALAAHRYSHYPTKASSYLCHICRKLTKSQLTLQFHYRKVHLNKTGGLCSQPNCDKVFESWKSWKRHERLHDHPGYICDICGQKYRHKHLIVEHLINHTNPPTHVCHVCGKTFLRLRNLRAHIENVHVKSDPLKCSHCNRMFKNEHYLKTHLKLLEMEKVWKCKFCSMGYPKLSALNSHLKSHSDERPHCCHICGSRYKAKSQLSVHMRNHTGDRPYKCVLCAKAFKSIQLLKSHAMVHTGILPHKCLHCEKMFRCKKRMMKHCALRHKTPDKNE